VLFPVPPFWVTRASTFARGTEADFSIGIYMPIS
jgi:hypothetical protein